LLNVPLAQPQTSLHLLYAPEPTFYIKKVEEIEDGANYRFQHHQKLPGAVASTAVTVKDEHWKREHS